MNLYMLEKAAHVIFAMCREHPEICPHDYEWYWTQNKDGKYIEHYKCNLCGSEYERIKDSF